MGERLCTRCKVNPQVYATSPWCGECLRRNTDKWLAKKREQRPPKLCACGQEIKERKRWKCEACRAPKPLLVPVTCQDCGKAEMGPRNKLRCETCRRRRVNRLKDAKRAAARRKKRCSCGAPVTEADRNLGVKCDACREECVRLKNADKSHHRRARKRSNGRGPTSLRVLWAAFSGLCPLCGVAVTRKNGHVDHIIALSRGGPHTQDNLQILCGPCNVRKDCMPPAAVVE